MISSAKQIKTNGESVKENKSVILKTVINNKGISRIEILKLAGVSNPTVSRIVDMLINEDGLLETTTKDYL